MNEELMNEEIVMENENTTPERIEINEQNPTRKIAVYGTLREGRGNWASLLQHRSKLWGTFKTEPAFTMFGKNYGFPIVVDKGTTAVEYEVFEIDQSAVLERVHCLESCTGIPTDPHNWYDIKALETPVGTAYMYVQHDLEAMIKERGEGSIIKSGNWNTKL